MSDIRLNLSLYCLNAIAAILSAKLPMLA